MIFRHLFTLIMTIAVTIALAIVSGYAANAAAHVEDISKAHSILIASSVIGWVSIGVTILAFIGLIVFAEEILISPWLRLIASLGIYAILFALILTGVLMAYAASVIHSDRNYGANKNSYSLSLHGSIVGLSIGGILVVTFIAVKVYTYYKGHHNMTQKNSYHPGSRGVDNIGFGLASKFLKL